MSFQHESNSSSSDIEEDNKPMVEGGFVEMTTSRNNQSTTFSKCGCNYLLHEFLTIILDDSGDVQHITKGLSTVFLSGIILGILLPHNPNLNGMAYQYFSSIIGYTYFMAWSVSFYPQPFLNHRRKDTEGLSKDFCYLNVFGFICYAAFNCSLFWSRTLQNEYKTLHNGETIKVQSNDVAFALHAVLLSSFWVIQIWWYNSTLKERLPSRPTVLFILGMIVFSIMYALMILFHGDSTSSKWNWLDFLYTLANFKVLITICKYAPQVYLNFRRRSTEGWNVWNVLLDFMGGTLSLLQLMGDCWNTNDWSGITGDPAKFALGFVSIFFDIIFFIQHYILYRASSPITGSSSSYHEISNTSPEVHLLQPPATEEMVGLHSRHSSIT